MAALPEPQHTTLQRIYQALVDRDHNEHRPHLGASLIGEPCERRLWYKFRWVAKEIHEGRMLRLFRTGHRAEETFAEDLRAAGVTVETHDENGDQFRISDHGGHFGGSMDGVGIGLVEAPKAWHVLEFKTHSAKSFDKLLKDGVKKHKPLHWHQMNTYMGYTEIDRALYLAENKDTSELFADRFEHDPVVFAKDRAKALRIIEAQEPLPRISPTPTAWECKFCEFKGVCHGTDIPEANCRTCSHCTPDTTRTPEKSDEGGFWRCGVHNGDVPVEFQRQGCEGHRYIPILLERVAKAVDYRDGVVIYETADGGSFGNGDGTDGTISSKEIYATGGEKIGALHEVRQLREQGFSGAKVAA